jgi:hypothetical protein
MSSWFQDETDMHAIDTLGATIYLLAIHLCIVNFAWLYLDKTVFNVLGNTGDIFQSFQHLHLIQHYSLVALHPMILNDKLFTISPSQVANSSVAYKSLIAEDNLQQLIYVFIDGDLPYHIIILCILEIWQINKRRGVCLRFICKLGRKWKLVGK